MLSLEKCFRVRKLKANNCKTRKQAQTFSSAFTVSRGLSPSVRDLLNSTHCIKRYRSVWTNLWNKLNFCQGFNYNNICIKRSGLNVKFHKVCIDEVGLEILSAKNFIEDIELDFKHSCSLGASMIASIELHVVEDVFNI